MTRTRARLCRRAAWPSAAARQPFQRVFEENSIHYRYFNETYRRDHDSEWESTFNESKAILQAAKEYYKGGYLFNVRGLIQVEIFDNVLEQTAELRQSGYQDPACVVAGVALETTPKELCARNGLAQNKLDQLNANLSKTGVYNMGTQIIAWAERRNESAHSDLSAYTTADVEDMIQGVIRLIPEYL